MWILYNKKATLYKYTRDSSTGISTYNQVWTTFACNIQPINHKDWLEWGIMLKQKKLYCSCTNISVWDKVVIDWITYIVDFFQRWDWIKNRYNKAFISESEGS